MISYVPQDASHLQGLLSDYAREHRLDESLFKAILRKLDFERVMFEKDIRDFSGGQKKKVLLAGSLCERAHLYIWDEPLNYIDVYSRMQLENLIRAFGRRCFSSSMTPPFWRRRRPKPCGCKLCGDGAFPFCGF